MDSKKINALNQQPHKKTKINKYCSKCKEVYLVSDYTSKCPVCKNILTAYKPIDDNQPNTPKCPTCGSTDVIKEHSNASVILSRTFFGPYSSSSWSQFRCNNCGYMW